MADEYAVKWDVAALNLTLEKSHELRAHLEELGAAGVAFGKSIALDAPPLQRGYIEGFGFSIGHDRDGVPVLCVANTDFKTWWIEAGTAPHTTGAEGGLEVSIPAHHVLDRTLDHLRS